MAEFEPTVDPFKSCLHTIARNIDKDELKQMKGLCRGIGPDKIAKAELEKIKTAMDLFIKLQEQGLLSQYKISLLQNLLDEIKRTDLIEELKKKMNIK
ncbi:FAS-associated death domain protein-like [Saccoglossus kowalevskii]